MSIIGHDSVLRFVLHLMHVHLCKVALQPIHHEGEGGEVRDLEPGWGAKELAIEGQHERKGYCLD